MSNIYELGLEQNEANYAALSPLSFLARSARVYPDYVSIIHGELKFTWLETYTRSLRLASALKKYGVGVGDTVAIMAPNTPAIFEAHFGIPMCGAVLNALNIRLDAQALAFILQHAEAKVLLTDKEFSPVIAAALGQLEKPPLVIDIDDVNALGGDFIGVMEYEDFLKLGDPKFAWQLPDKEWNAISLNYTSGTTGDPKGVVYHHRGAYLNALSNIVGWDMQHHPRYLWTLPMFHCNGWCFPWTLAAVAGTSICLRQVNAKNIFASIADHGATHFCGAPVVLRFVLNATAAERRAFSHKVRVMTAAAPPPAAVLKAMQQAGFEVTHVYGLTETYGPAVMNAWKGEWDQLDEDARARIKARQGVPYHVLEDLQVLDPQTMQAVPWDGETMGEIMFKGNIVMKGYLKNSATTEKSLASGWFHSGDLAVMEPDGYIRIKDRSKDIIISGGENISSIEVEDTLYKHPHVAEVAVVARPDNKWGETPCAFVTLKSDSQTYSEQDLIDYCRENLAGYRCPKTIVFSDLPKTSTGKIQKYKLRQHAQELGSLN